MTLELNDLFGLKGKNVVITGTGSGMGHAAAELLVQLGANVYAATHRRPLDIPVTASIACDLSNTRTDSCSTARRPMTVPPSSTIPTSSAGVV